MRGECGGSWIQKFQTWLNVFFICALFMAVGPALMILNKKILDDVHFPYPLLVSSMGLVFSALVTHSLKAVGMLTLQYESTVDKKFWLGKCLPVGVCHAATLAFGNAQYVYTGMAVIQFLKSFTPIVTAIVTYTLLSRKETWQAALALVVLCIGTSMAASGDSSISTLGLLLAVGSSVTEAIRLVMTDYLLSGVKMQVLESVYWLSPAGGICLFLTGCVVEGPALMGGADLSKIAANPLTFFLAASLGLMVQLLTTSVIKATSAVALKVLSQIRNTIPVVYGVVVYGEVITAFSATGYCISVVAFAGYTRIKMGASS
eukprot:CAMPEP_0181288346 /NCGR_PEP_ID=MMETSP1101-20121128/283_1 /TAXON_ID=46948 /ORGANISM="Rhodomonas abbreviata, Strain Caron Lab Isolate" /LENGTH=316 /DNA_ID=CAMNT_0023392461 /DNA_START=136 /DNA_END=1083 /DNA_ORIENTATION=+